MSWRMSASVLARCPHAARAAGSQACRARHVQGLGPRRPTRGPATAALHKQQQQRRRQLQLALLARRVSTSAVRPSLRREVNNREPLDGPWRDL